MVSEPPYPDAEASPIICCHHLRPLPDGEGLKIQSCQRSEPDWAVERQGTPLCNISAWEKSQKLHSPEKFKDGWIAPPDAKTLKTVGQVLEVKAQTVMKFRGPHNGCWCPPTLHVFRPNLKEMGLGGLPEVQTS